MDDASEVLRYARLLRPFPVKRLNDRILHQLMAQAISIGQEVQQLLIDPPTTPEPWCESLASIGMKVETLAELCDETAPLIELLIDQADADFQRSVLAMEAVMSGLRAVPPEVSSL